MAMTGLGMKSAVKAAWESATGQPMPAAAESVWLAVCGAIVTYIQTNAQVAVVSVSGVTTGPGVSGPGTGTVL